HSRLKKLSAGGRSDEFFLLSRFALPWLGNTRRAHFRRSTRFAITNHHLLEFLVGGWPTVSPLSISRLGGGAPSFSRTLRKGWVMGSSPRHKYRVHFSTQQEIPSRRRSRNPPFKKRRGAPGNPTIRGTAQSTL